MRRPLPRAHRRGRARLRRGRSRSSRASSASARRGWAALARGRRARARRGPARPRRRQARRHRRLGRRLRPGAGRQHADAVRRRRRASAPTPSPPARTWASTRSSRCSRPRAPPRAGVFVLVRTSNPGAADVEDLEPAARRHGVGARGGDRRRARRARRRRRCSDVGAVVGATAPEHLARMRELMPRTPFLLPGIGAQGGRVEDLAPAFAPAAPAGWSPRRARSRRAHEQPPAATRAPPRAPRPSGCAPPPGRSPSVRPGRRAPAALRPDRPPYAPEVLMRRRRSPGRWLAPMALVACAVAVYAVVNATLLKDDGGRRRRRPRRPRPRSPGRRRPRARRSAQAPSGLRRQAGRHAVGDLDQDRRLARAHPGAQPEARRPGASDRPADQALAVTSPAAAVRRPRARRRRPRVAAARSSRPRRRGPPRRRAVVRAPAAILVEPATGDVVYGRNARRRARRSRSTTKLMTALLDARAREALDDVHARSATTPRPAESSIGLRAGERMTVADLLRGLLLPSANDAAATLAVRVGGTRARFVAPDEQPRARSSACATRTTRTRSASTSRATTRAPRDLVELALILRAQRVLPRGRRTCRARRCSSGARPRTIVNRNTLVRTRPRRQRREDRPHVERRLRARRLGHAATA